MADKTPRAELIAALVTDKYSTFKEGDEALLETASDARLEEFRTAADKHKTADQSITRLETDNRNVAARLKVAEERVRLSETTLSEEEFVARAPESIKALLAAHKADEDAFRGSVISQLKDLGANTEDELKKKSTAELKTLAKYARVSVNDYSGRALPRALSTSEDTADFTPPDPYKGDIEKLRVAEARH